MTGGLAGDPPRGGSPDLDNDPALDDPTPPTPPTPPTRAVDGADGDDLPPPFAEGFGDTDDVDGSVGTTRAIDDRRDADRDAEALEPAVPRDTTAAAPPTAATPLRATSSPTGVAYRSTDERNRSVYRRANPWYRRLARGVIATSLVGGLGIGVYLGARELRDYLDRDRLPAAGAETPPIRTTSILVTSTAPELLLQGTLVFDADTGAFEFTGTPDGPDAGVRLTSPDGTTVYREDGADWLLLAPEDGRASAAREAIRVLDDDGTADAILVNRLRRGHVDLIRQVEEGAGEDELTRYDIALDLTGFADAFPLQWTDFRVESIPGVAESPRHVVSLWLDTDDVLVRVDDQETGWSWQRLTYSPSAFQPFRPAPAAVVQPSTAVAVEGVFCSIDRLGIGWTTALDSCDAASSLGRDLAVAAGLADDPTDPAAELAFGRTCVALQDGQTLVEDAATLGLAEQLDAAGVCPGDLERLRAALPAAATTDTAATSDTTDDDG